MIASRIVVRAEAGPAAVMTAARQEVPDVWQAASVVARCHVTAQAIRDAGGLARRVISWALGTGTPTTNCPVVQR